MEINIWLKVYTEIWWTWTLLISPVPKVIEVNLKFCRTKQQSITRSPRNLQSFLFFGLHDFFQCAYHSVKIWFSTTAGTAKSLQSCPTLCNPIDGNPQGSPVPGILQARTLEWVAISFSNAWKWKVKGTSTSTTVNFMNSQYNPNISGETLSSSQRWAVKSRTYWISKTQ